MEAENRKKKKKEKERNPATFISLLFKHCKTYGHTGLVSNYLAGSQALLFT